MRAATPFELEKHQRRLTCTGGPFAHHRGDSLYLVAGRSGVVDKVGHPEALLVLDLRRPAEVRIVGRLALPSTDEPALAPIHGGLAVAAGHLYWGTTAGMRVYGLERPLAPQLVALWSLPRRGWYGLIDERDGLGAAVPLGDLLLVAQGHLKVLDATDDSRGILDEITLEREVAGQSRTERPFDIEVIGDHAWVLGRVEEREPAMLRALRIERRPTVFVPVAMRR